MSQRALSKEDAAIFESIHVVNDLTDAPYQSAQPPYVSLYLPVQHEDREGGRNDWDRIELKDLIKEAQENLERMCSDKSQFEGIEKRLRFIEAHPDWFVWQNSKSAIAFLISNTAVFVYQLDIDIPNKGFVTVSDQFFMKPLFRAFEHGMRYYLLMLSNDHFGFVEGDQSSLRRMPMPQSVHDEFSELFEDYDGHEGALDYETLEGHMSPYHGWLSRNDVKKEEGEKFFRYVNKAVNDTFKKHDPTPVILVCLPEHQTEFRRICTIHDVLDKGIEKDPGSLSYPELLKDAVGLMEDYREQDIKKLLEQYSYEASQGKGSSDPVQIGQALYDKKVGTLFMQKGKVLPGSFDGATGTVTLDSATDPQDDKEFDPASPDLVDELGQAALLQGAQIIVLPEEQMPDGCAVAAIYRY